MTQVLLRELPNLLSELRDEDIALGALRSLPLSPAQVWGAAIEEAMETADREILGSLVRSFSLSLSLASSLSLSRARALSLSLIVFAHLQDTSDEESRVMLL
jgi:hypothetical protein